MKTTLRLPDPLWEELHQRSEREGRSLNATVVDLLWRALGRDIQSLDITAALGPFISRPAQAPYDPKALTRASAIFAGHADGVLEALEWSRGKE